MKDFLNLTAAYLSSRTSEKNPNKFGIKVGCLQISKHISCRGFRFTFENRKLTTMPAMMTNTVDKTEINVSYGKRNISSYDSFHQC